MYLTNQTIIQNGTINGWTPTEDSMSGVIEFHSPTTDIILFATPNWDEDGYVPFAIYDSETDDYDAIAHSLELSGSIEEQLTQYVSQIQLITSQLR
jgi:hypothetical protein